MTVYKAPVDDVLFLLRDVFDLPSHADSLGFTDTSLDVVEAILAEAAKFCERALVPLNRAGDVEGCVRHDNGQVTTPAGFRQAYAQLADSGAIGVALPAAFGGLGLPAAVSYSVSEFLASANMAFAMYPALTQGVVATLLAHGTPEQKQRFLPPLVTGRWSGTMNLTEAQCGTDLGLIRTKAVRQPDGSFRLSGTKIFISAGEHDLTENIVHLVLARTEQAPAGTKGLSLFLVPKILVEADGSLGAANAVSCGAIEKKMGIHGNATCVMNYDGAQGWLVAQENRGLQAMFTMMNEARLVVGVQGLALSEAAYQNAAAYARERLQGRALSGAKFPEQPADPIIVHPDVRRMLMSIRAINEAGRALVLWTTLESDRARRAGDPHQRQAAEDHLGLLTPVIKGVLTDCGFVNAATAQQVFGGHGYIAEWGMEQFVRDARIPMIYEGANGIQALDLVGRKLGRNGGRAVMAFFATVQRWTEEHAADPALRAYAAPLAAALGDLQQATVWFAQNALAKPDNAGAGAYDYMHLFGLVALGYMWARIAAAAQHAIERDPGTHRRMQAKLVTARFFMERMLPETALRLARIRAGAASTMELAAEDF